MQDPRCDFVQPGEVFCLMCRNWIKLYKDVPYIDANWTRHAERCQIRNRYVLDAREWRLGAYTLYCSSSLQYQRRDNSDDDTGAESVAEEAGNVELSTVYTSDITASH